MLIVSAATTANAEVLRLCDQSVDAVIAAPEAGVPAALSAYLGVWAGTWEHGTCAAIVVESVKSDGSVRYIQIHGERGGIYAERAGIVSRAGNYKDNHITATVLGGTIYRNFAQTLSLQGSTQLLLRNTTATEQYAATLTRLALSTTPQSRSAAPQPSPPVRPSGGAQAFDGAWAVTMTCADIGSAKGYTIRYQIEIGGGVISGQYGVPDAVGSLTITGEIKPDGIATMRAVGRVGNSANAFSGAAAGGPVNYGITARLEGKRGAGTRTEQRPCTLSYEKQ